MSINGWSHCPNSNGNNYNNIKCTSQTGDCDELDFFFFFFFKKSKTCAKIVIMKIHEWKIWSITTISKEMYFSQTGECDKLEEKKREIKGSSKEI